MKVATLVAVLAALCNVCIATFGTITIALAAPTATSVLLGVGLLKAAAVTAFLASRRGRREANDNVTINEDETILLAGQIEPDQCYRRLICDLATGAIPSANAELMTEYFGANEVAPSSPKFELSVAAKLGKQLRNVQMCELRYSCPISGAELAKFL